MKNRPVLFFLLSTALFGCSPHNHKIKVEQQIISPNQNSRIKYIVIHYTAADFRNTINIFNDQRRAVSAHYVIPELGDNSYPYRELKIFQLVKGNKRAWHAGISHWKNNDSLNDQSIGIELVNKPRCQQQKANEHGGFYAAQQGFCYFPDYRPEQMQALLVILTDLMEKYPHIQATDIVGHSDIAPGRKLDPGARFPWQLLYQHGYGAWFDDVTLFKYAEQFSQKLPTVLEIQQALKEYGYAITLSGTADEQTQAVITAFQQHFVQDNVTGSIDVKTSATLFALMEKYYPDWQTAKL